MQIHPDIARRFAPLQAIDPDAAADPVALALLDEYKASFAAPWELPAVDVRDETVPGPHGDVPVRVYRPSGATGPLPGLVWLHGGAWVAGDLDMPEAHVVAAEIAAAASAVVVSVDYRLAGATVKYPVPVDDTCAVWDNVVAGRVAGLDTTRVALGGASAGGNIALGATMRLRETGGAEPAALLLAYPVAHIPLPAPDDALAEVLRQVPEVLRFTQARSLRVLQTYLGRIDDIPVEVSPGHGRLAGLPPTWLGLSEIDTLRPSGELFADQLRAVGVPVQVDVAAGMLHGHLNLVPRPELPEVRRTLDFLIDGLRAAVGEPVAAEAG